MLTICLIIPSFDHLALYLNIAMCQVETPINQPEGLTFINHQFWFGKIRFILLKENYNIVATEI